ncbi:LysR family transcriptional regulator [Sphingomonas sp. Root710]|uniref:LysR substrate-binding domain-containing protein n=1 Tax=Sphingomonas sp. Root710 TaxID=1736594 RepID=UPI0006FD15CB|nr:LysR substrate-binding domain-containing protein [Sphingomonas sp. Root710]KRB85521.1 LysR family transcriptional regulator [Sphingomonas sp. Root710]
MELRLLHYFVTLAETSNFHRAAERLHISQPPLTVAIRKLEQELGAPLFDRNPRGVTLTAAGEAALEPARATLAQAEQVRQAAKQGVAGERGRLTIGFVGSATFALLPRLIEPFRRKYPAVELILNEGNSLEIQNKVEAGSLDLGLVRLPLQRSSKVTTAVVERDQLVAALPNSHPLARKRRLDLRQLADEPFIVHSEVSILRATTVAACQNAGFVARIVQEAVQLQTILSLVQSGLGVALVPAKAQRFAPDRVTLVPLAELIDIELGVLHAPSGNAVIHNFVRMATDKIDS